MEYVVLFYQEWGVRGEKFSNFNENLVDKWVFWRGGELALNMGKLGTSRQQSWWEIFMSLVLGEALGQAGRGWQDCIGFVVGMAEECVFGIM